jgi:hypothetical protein
VPTARAERFTRIQHEVEKHALNLVRIEDTGRITIGTKNNLAVPEVLTRIHCINGAPCTHSNI